MTDDTIRQEIITLTAALLASGHYTHVQEFDDGEIEARLRRSRVGPEWSKEQGEWGCFHTCAVEVAIDIRNEIIAAIETNKSRKD